MTQIDKSKLCSDDKQKLPPEEGNGGKNLQVTQLESRPIKLSLYKGDLKTGQI